MLQIDIRDVVATVDGHVVGPQSFEPVATVIGVAKRQARIAGRYVDEVFIEKPLTEVDMAENRPESS